MRGSETVRFCSHCAKNVHDLSAMTRKQAKRIVAASNGNLCVRYVRRADGSIKTAERRLYQIGGRASRLAASVFSASLAISGAAYAQHQETVTQGGVQPLPKTQSVVELINANKNGSTGQIVFTIVGQNGAAVGDAKVTLTSQKTNKRTAVWTNNNGVAQFKNLEFGNYEIEVVGGRDFQKPNKQFVEVKNAVEPDVKITLEIFDTNLMGDVGIVGYQHPLLQAVAQMDVEAVQGLIAASVNLEDRDGFYNDQTALHVAADMGNQMIMKLLLDAGADVEARTKSQETPLLMIDHEISRGTASFQTIHEDASPQIVRLLIERGANVNAQDDKGETALMKAAHEGNPAVVKILLAAGADQSLTNKKGETALDKSFNKQIEKTLKLHAAPKH